MYILGEGVDVTRMGILLWNCNCMVNLVAKQIHFSFLVFGGNELVVLAYFVVLLNELLEFGMCFAY